MLAQQVLNHWTIIPVLEGGVILSFKSPKKGQKNEGDNSGVLFDVEGVSKGCAVSEAGEMSSCAPGVLFGKGAVACRLNVCSVVTHLHPRWRSPYGGTWHLRFNSVEIPKQSKVHLPNTSSGDRQLTSNLTQVTALWSQEQSQLLTLLSKQSVRGACETVGNSLYICSLSRAHLKFLQFVLILHYTSPHCHLHTNSLLLATSMCTWHSQLDVVEIKSGKLQLELSLQEEIDSIFIWNIHTTNYTFIFKTMHTPQNIQTYFHQHICPSKVNSYILHLYIHLFVHPLTNLPIHLLTHSPSMHPSSLHQLIYPRIH